MRIVIWFAMIDVLVISVVCVKLFYFERVVTPNSTASSIMSPVTAQTQVGDVSLTGSISSFMARMENTGLNATVLKSIKRSAFAVTGQMISINGDNVQVFEYPDRETATRAASSLMVKYAASSRSREWKRDMHVYAEDDLVIFYMGNDEAIISAIQPSSLPSTLSTLSTSLKSR
jgi:hypothetical protein